MVKPIAFYLPQYHRIAENDAWWGEGFTEWTNVRKAKPNWEGHYQPHVPRELGYYDLSDVDVQRQQAALAKKYGVHGFCYYHYWFAGRRVLEKPVELLLKTPDIDLPFCVCWANENWTRTWDGKEKDILLSQNHTPQDDEAFLRALLPAFKDPRYIKVDGAPMLLVYRADLFPDSKATAERWRRLAREAGFPGLHLCAVQFYGITDPKPWGFDAAVEFPPHTFLGPENHPDVFPTITNQGFHGGIVDYTKVAAQSLARPEPGYPWYRGIMPSWDNTARRQDTPHIFINSSPFEYQYWLRRLAEQTQRRHERDHQYLFINAWNEWGEGCHLEPDQRYGLMYLEATAAALKGDTSLEAAIAGLKMSGGANGEAKLLLESYQAHQRSVLALKQLVRQKNERIAQLEAEVRELRQAADSVAGFAKHELKKFPRAFELLKGVRKRVRGS